MPFTGASVENILRIISHNSQWNPEKATILKKSQNDSHPLWDARERVRMV